MKVKKLLEIQSVIEESKIPCDMTDEFKYWSRSKGDWVNILDMDLVHVVRALNLESKLELERHKDKNLQKIKEHESAGRTFGSKDIIIVHSGGQEFEISCLIPEENLNTCKIEVE